MRRDAVFAYSLLLAGGAGFPSLAASGTSTHVVFTYVNDIQTGLIAQFPAGTFTASDTWKTKFHIPIAKPSANPPRYNFYDAPNTPLTVSTAIAGATEVYTLINAYRPPSGQVLASVEFKGSTGADKVFQLTGGTNIRDFYQGAFADTINGTSTRNAYTIQNVQGGAGTGNVNTGETGTYNIDEQRFLLPAAFKTQTLSQIIVTSTGAGGSRAIVLGITVHSVAGTTVMLDGLRP